VFSICSLEMLFRIPTQGLVGLTLHGPYFQTMFGFIDARFGPALSLGNVLKKTAVAQFTAFPIYLPLLFAYLALLEGQAFSAAVEYAKVKAPTAFAVGCGFWPLANAFGFRFVGPQVRVL
jgi:protein Mpv17